MNCSYSKVAFVRTLQGLVPQVWNEDVSPCGAGGVGTGGGGGALDPRAERPVAGGHIAVLAAERYDLALVDAAISR